MEIKIKDSDSFKVITLEIKIQSEEDLKELKEDFLKTGPKFCHRDAFNKLYHFFQDLE